MSGVSKSIAQPQEKMDGRAPYPLEDKPGHLIRRVQQVAVRLFSEHVSADMTPVQFAALVALDSHPRIGQAALAAIIGYDRATIGGVIDRLESKGLVARSADPDDRRSNILTLTSAGHAAMIAATPEVEAVQTALLAPLNANERLQFEAMCRKILQANRG